MEKYARQLLSDGVRSAEEIHVGIDSEVYRVLNLHYNRNNHIEVTISHPSIRSAADRFQSPLVALARANDVDLFELNAPQMARAAIRMRFSAFLPLAGP